MSDVLWLAATVVRASVLHLTGAGAVDGPDALVGDDQPWPDGFSTDGPVPGADSGPWDMPGLADPPGFFQLGGGMVALVLVVGVALVITLAVLAYRREKVRVSAVEAWALGGGWTMVGRDDSWVGTFSGSPFGQGESRHADDVCTRVVDGLQQVVFTYRFETTSTQTTTNADGSTSTRTSTTDHAYTVVARALPAPLGPLQIVQETVGQKAARAFGGQDVEVELAEFNRRYRVTADDAKHALDLLNPRTVERLMARADASLRLLDGWATSTAVGALQPDTAQERLGVLADLLEGVPSFVWKDRGWSGGLAGVTPCE